MIKIENPKGKINVYDQVIARIAGKAAMECYGVVAMAATRVTDNLVSLLKWDNMDRGVTVISSDDSIKVQIHIAVLYGVNIPAITQSIVHKVKYTLEQMTGLIVSDVEVFVDTMKVS